MKPSDRRFAEGLHYLAKSLLRRFPQFTPSEIDDILDQIVREIAPSRSRTRIGLLARNRIQEMISHHGKDKQSP